MRGLLVLVTPRHAMPCSALCNVHVAGLQQLEIYEFHMICPDLRIWHLEPPAAFTVRREQLELRVCVQP
jgi:hypothetical protein